MVECDLLSVVQQAQSSNSYVPFLALKLYIAVALQEENLMSISMVLGSASTLVVVIVVAAHQQQH